MWKDCKVTSTRKMSTYEKPERKKTTGKIHLLKGKNLYNTKKKVPKTRGAVYCA